MQTKRVFSSDSAEDALRAKRVLAAEGIAYYYRDEPAELRPCHFFIEVPGALVAHAEQALNQAGVHSRFIPEDRFLAGNLPPRILRAALVAWILIIVALIVWAVLS